MRGRAWLGILLVTLAGLGIPASWSSVAWAGCATLEQLAARMESMTEGTPINVKSIRGNEYSGIVQEVLEGPDGRRIVRLMRSDGTIDTVYVDQFDPTTFRGPFDRLPTGTRIKVTSLSGNVYSGKFGGISPINPGEIILTDDTGISQTLKIGKLKEASVRAEAVRPPAAAVVSAPPARLDPVVPAIRPAQGPEAFAPDTRVELVSVRGNKRSGYIQGQSPDGHVIFKQEDGQILLLDRAKVNWGESRAAPAVRGAPVDKTGVAKLFEGQPSFDRYGSRGGNFGKQVKMPDGRRLPIFYTYSDTEMATKAGKIFTNVNPAKLPRGKSYTFVVMNDGEMIFGEVDNAWELGVKHAHLQRGRPAFAAGELKVDEAGNLTYNLESGSTTEPMIARKQTTMEALKQRMDRVFYSETGHEPTYTDQVLLPKRTPTASEISNYCANAIFAAANYLVCH